MLYQLLSWCKWLIGKTKLSMKLTYYMYHSFILFCILVTPIFVYVQYSMYVAILHVWWNSIYIKMRLCTHAHAYFYFQKLATIVSNLLDNSKIDSFMENKNVRSVYWSVSLHIMRMCIYITTACWRGCHQCWETSQ